MKLFSLFFLFMVLCFYQGYTQLWTGSLGDPIVNISFGQGSNAGPQLGAGQTEYVFSGRSCPGEGEYSLLNLSFGCGNGTWQTLVGDHTIDDVAGYYMLVNGASTNKNLINYNLTGLCANTTYEFSVWVKNALKPGACAGNAVQPDLLFTVETTDGIILKSYKTGKIAPDNDNNWKQYGTTFKTTGNITDVVLRLKSQTDGGCGNVFALDDAAVSPCGPSIAATLVANNSNLIEVCAVKNQFFDLAGAFNPEFANPIFQWQSLEIGLGWNSLAGGTIKSFRHTKTDAGTYRYRLLVKDGGSFEGSKCSFASNTITINIVKAPFVQATNYVFGCLGNKVSLFAVGAGKYSWTGPGGYTSQDQSPILTDVQFADSGIYKVTGTTTIGCSNSDSTILRVYPNATATSIQGTTICEGQSTVLFASGGARYQWIPAQSLSNDTVFNPVARPVENTRYKVEVTNEYGCTDTAAIIINVWKKPQANAGPDLKTRVGLSTTLNGTATGSDLKWLWTPSVGLSSNQVLNPRVSPTITTTYRLLVESIHGCGSSTDLMTVKVYDKIDIPNAFSPNGDGINDNWVIDPLEIFDDAITQVFNRYGQVVYSTRGYVRPWNGTSNGQPLPAGTYYYIIDLKIKKEDPYKGPITILR